MMELRREPSSPHGTFGKLYIDGAFECDTLEPERPMPAGRYTIYPWTSPKFKRTVLRFVNVPGHTDVEMHPGNSKDDTKLCILPGVRNAGMVWHSAAALDAILKKVTQTCDITIKEPS